MLNLRSTIKGGEPQYNVLYVSYGAETKGLNLRLTLNYVEHHRSSMLSLRLTLEKG